MNVNGYLIEAHAAELIKARVGAADAHRRAVAARGAGGAQAVKPPRRRIGVRVFWRRVDRLATSLTVEP